MAEPTVPEDFDPRFQQVKCDRCGREYQCTPWDDYYRTPRGDSCCEPCMLGGRPMLYVFEQEDGSLAGPFGPLAPLAGETS